VAHTDFATIDEQKFKAFHWRTTLTTGLGVFCDGYDLSSVALVLPLILQSFGQKSLTSVESQWLAGGALLGAAVGALIFGVLGQKGRRTFYGLDVLILGIAAAAQAFAPNVVWLIVIRLVLGFGVGADYVLSPVIMAEHSNRADRGRALGLGFGTMWPVGALAAVLFKFLLDFLHVPPDLEWRLVLAGGAVPALAVLYFRRTMPETARFLARLGGQHAEARRVMEEISGVAAGAPTSDERSFWEVFRLHAKEILAAALLWMMYDLVVYVFILFGPNIIAKSIGMDPKMFALLTQVLFVLPASVLGSLFIIDRVGRKPLQGWGFVGGAVLLGVFALMQNQLLAMPAVAFAVYGALNVAMTGPGLVSGAGILGVELAPTRVRSVAQSITVAGGRIGAAISGFVFPMLFAGSPALAYWVVVGLALLGALFTWLLVPETGRISLEALTEAPAAQKA
jgi:MFS family permease